ncbi:MAG: TfoX/Sxy family protein [Rhizobacter sp.]
MATTPEFVAYCAELLGALGPARVKRMFGGHGFYVDDVFLALAMADRLYLKTDAQTRPRFEAAGCEPFVYGSGGEQVSIGYWTVPDDAMESPALMLPWTRLAMEAALRARNAKPPKRAATKTISPKRAPAKRKPAAKPKR